MELPSTSQLGRETPVVYGGRYWDRTSDPFGVNEADAAQPLQMSPATHFVKDMDCRSRQLDSVHTGSRNQCALRKIYEVRAARNVTPNTTSHRGDRS